VGAELFHANRETDRHEEANSRFLFLQTRLKTKQEFEYMVNAYKGKTEIQGEIEEQVCNFDCLGK
jgi:putative IMPACT (imprinted ancient) family translation regulator